MPKVIIVLVVVFSLPFLCYLQLYGNSGFLKKLLTRELYRTYLCEYNIHKKSDKKILKIVVPSPYFQFVLKYLKTYFQRNVSLFVR